MQIRATLTLTSPILTQPQALRERLARVVEETALAIDRDIKERMRAPKSGRTYRRGAITRRASKRSRSLGLRERTTKGGNRVAIVGAKFHRASAPGEAPAVDQGALINSIAIRRLGPLGRRIVSPQRYALPLELGIFFSKIRGRATIKIEARPSFGPAVEAARPGFEQAVDLAVRECL